jgi:hypothetical protein
MRTTSTRQQPEPGGYEIRTHGHLDARWRAYFDGLVLTSDADGTTVIHGPELDQAALYAVLLKLRDLGLPLLSVTGIPDETGPNENPPR